MKHQSFWQFFVAAAITYPDALAIASDRESITYETLLHKVYAYIQVLDDAGVQQDMAVAIMLPRNGDLLIAILSVLAIGAHYIPLDVKHPAQRTETVLNDSECQWLITDTSVSYPNVCLLPRPSGEMRATLPFLYKHEPQQLAYIIYTSGSTGKPKGVMITQANLSAFLTWAQAQYSREDLAYVLAVTSICFDLSIFECLVTLTQGGCVVLVDHALEIIDQAPDYPVTLMNTVPSAIEALLQAKAIPPTIRVINLAGEALSQSLVNALYEHTNVERVYNLYGPTETTTYSTSYLVTRHNERTMVPIGRPIVGTQILILDQHQQPMPTLMRGEIYIIGLGVTLGYKNLLQETQSAFVELAVFGKKIRAYRTGDLARMNQDGELEYLGRMDHQIKIRGFRIEPDEIVHVLRQHEAVNQAYVMVDDSSAGGVQLIVYLVLANSHSDDAGLIDQLKIHLAQHLPEYMIPYHFMLLKQLPLNQNGKIDRAKLPKPEQKIEVVHEFHSEIEQQLADIWCALLQHTSFARDDNFFYAGGHSILAARLQATIQEAFNISLKLEDIFNCPTLALQANLIFAKQQAGGTQRFSFEISPRPANIPMSFGQQRIWYQQWAEPTIPISNIPILITLHGELDVAAFDQSIRTLIEHHEILRTTYHSRNFNLVQDIEQEWNFATQVVSCEQDVLAGLLDIEANRPFDLSTDLMIRSTLFKVNQGRKHYLMLTQHHIASDAWSLNILMHEISVLYKAYHRSQALPQLSDTTAYADYSCWQRMHLDATALKEELDYWRQMLNDAPDFIRLPYDKPRPEGTTYHGEFYEWELPPELLTALESLAFRQGTTLFVVLLAAFNALLYHYTRQNDFCIGILTANRPFKSLDHTLGFFVNTLVMRNQFDSKISIKQLLRRVKQLALQALHHQQLPFDKLVEALHPNRQGSRHPYFQVLFSLQNVLENELDLDGLEIDVASYDRKIAKFDLTLSFFKKRDVLAAIFEFNTDLFYRETIARMVENYFEILKTMVQSQDLTVGEMNIIPQNQYHYWMDSFNATTKLQTKSKTIVDCFAESVSSMPTKIALISGNAKITYGELEKRANQLAHYMQQQGVARGTGVALLLPRSIDTIISMLAVLKIGAFYVPMDPAWPIQRIDFMLNDARVKLILSEKNSITQLPTTIITLALLDDLYDQLQVMPSIAPNVVFDASDSCYVMYTSGSTGKPKGVVALHQGVVRLVRDQNYVRLNEQQTILQVSQLAFDGSTFDIWGALLNGGTLVLMPDGLPVLQILTDLINAHAVTTLFVTTQLFNALVDYRLDALKPLQQILFGGDVASIHHVSTFKNAYPSCALSNIYGPTECTTYALSYLIPENIDNLQRLPIGKPITNTYALILSDDMQLVPVNVPGEIYLGGPGLAKGYLNDPELTSEKFIPNSFAAISSERLYRTGDLGCYSTDGNIVFLGRMDNQIKRRGYRIELNEIEQVIRELDEITDAVVVLQKPEDLLIAYVIAPDNIPVSLQAIKHKLASRLPSYMMPDALEQLAEYPLTVNGKIDKQQLPRHQVIRQEMQNDALLDKHLGKQIRDIWVEVLNDDEVTYQDNFFEIGGNSLKIVHILERFQTTLSASPALLDKLDITALFQYPTIESLVHYLITTSVNSDESISRTHVARARNKRQEAIGV